MEVNPSYTSIPQLSFLSSTTAIMHQDKPPDQLTCQRKKNIKSQFKGKSPVGSNNAYVSEITDSHEKLFLPPVLQTPAKKLAERKQKVAVAKVEEESSLAVCLQVLLPYLLAGMGMVTAGIVLHSVQVSTGSTFFWIICNSIIIHLNATT